MSQQVLLAILMQGLIITRFILFKRKIVLWSIPPPTAERLTFQGLNNFGCCGAAGWDPKCLLCDRRKKQELWEPLTDPPMGDGVSPIEAVLSDSQACRQKFEFLSYLSGNCKFTESGTEGQLFSLV